MDIHKQKQRIRSKIKLDQSREKIKHRFRKVSDFKKKKQEKKGEKENQTKRSGCRGVFLEKKVSVCLQLFK
jgi:hypothetical protein